MSCDSLSLGELRVLASAKSVKDAYAVSRRALCETLNLSERRDYGESLRRVFSGDRELFDVCLNPPKHGASSMEPKLHQKLVRHAMMRKETRGLIVFHGLGSGKTLTSILSASAWLKKNKDGKVLVVVNASMRDQFRTDIKASSKRWRRFTVVSREQYLKDPSSCAGKFLIVDEAHNLRGPDSKTTKSLMKCSSRAAKVMLLTATPIVNGVHEIAVLANIVNPRLELPMNRDKFIETYGRSGLKRKAVLLQKLKGLVSYYLNAECGYPRKEIHEVFIPMAIPQRDAYDALMKKERTIESLDAWGSEDQMERAMKFFQKPRQMCNVVSQNGVKYKPKIDALVSNVVDAVLRGRKCLVYSQYLDAGVNEIEDMLRRAKVKLVKIVGDMNATKKNEAKCAFNSGKARVLLISRSGSEGLDLKETGEVHLLEPHWNPVVTNQVIGRAVRYQSHKSPDAVVRVFTYYAEKNSPRKRHHHEVSKMDVRKESFDYILWNINWIKTLATDTFVREIIVPSSIEASDYKAYARVKEECPKIASFPLPFFLQ